METLKPKYSRVKKSIKEMYPVKKWLSLPEACSFMDMSVHHFQDLAAKNNLTLSMIGKKKFWKVSELENLIEDNILIKKVS